MVMVLKVKIKIRERSSGQLGLRVFEFGELMLKN